MASTSSSFNNGLLPPRSTIHDLFRARHQAEAEAQAAKIRSPATNKSPTRRASARNKLTSHTKSRPLSSSSSATNRLDRTTTGTSTTKKRKAVAVTPHVDSDDSDIEILPSTLKSTTTSGVKRSKAITKEAPTTDGKNKSSVRAESISIDLTMEDEEEVSSEQVSADVAATELNANHDDDDGEGEGHRSRDAVEREQSFGQWDNDEGAHEGEQDLFWDQSDDDHDEPYRRSETPSRAAQAKDEMWGEEGMLQDSDGDDVVFADEFDDQPITAIGQQGSSKDLEPVHDHASSNPSTCPICSISLGFMSKKAREAHANTCLDECDDDSVSKPAGRGIFSSMFGNHSKPAPTSTKDKGKTVSTPADAPSNGRRPLSSFMPSFSFGATSSTSSSGPGAPNAFTALMTGHAETKQWKLAEEADKQKGRVPKGEFKKVPFYKWVEGLQITVDAFRYNAIQGCKAYFLTHAHSDHYQNLSASWDHGPIYCSYTTANLIKLKLGVKDEYLKPLPMNETVKVHGIDVTLIDANHCPGSVLFLFEGPHTDPNSPYSKTPSRIFRYLHCGDFRAAPPHVLHPAVKNKRIDICYLDTTYLDSKYCFPAQELVIEACAQLVRERVLEGDEEALNRLAGEAEVGMRKGMKGWLSGRGVKKGEEEEEEEEGKAGLGVGKVEDEEEDERVMREMEEEQVMMGEEAEMVKAEQGRGGEVVKDEEEPLDGAKEERKPKLEKEDSKKPKKEKLLVMVGTYSIGKERIVKELTLELFCQSGIAKALGTKIYCDERKSAILSAQDDPELHALMTSDPLEGQVHMCWLNSVNRDAMSDYHAQYSAKRMEGGYTQVIELRPTGWTYKAEGSKGEKTPTIAKILERERLRKFSAAGMCESADETTPWIEQDREVNKLNEQNPCPIIDPQRDSTSTFLGYGVPYSEHSSFYELTCFALSLDYVRMIPTVNVHTPASRKRMDDWMTRWKAEKKRRADARIPRLVEPRSENYW
ncbi:BZ3500_MvSof-1268-A1-R1_Chr7-1g09262 [Microbotryum saponariae]|uniref:BZ3500_MvSof-1268-A1-R1_Chr7-1g09262 protein n=1 Tax=Microbotryum saponariae TaxID=289078 RepID=A0A2X0N2D7_9BASI|nr:BZ3501_MvSof-1269-A2-R1_Chr7-1g08967 [Microbotryum saponariae]SDA03108.1 BZ3500_MvSof-1268-A1-R1_Chr7-1g09262 [Microbotryum saponariae]